jgi:hypothetical protein
MQPSEVRRAHYMSERTRQAATAAEIVRTLRQRIAPRPTMFDDEMDIQRRLEEGVFTDEACAEAAHALGQAPAISTAEEAAWDIVDGTLESLRLALSNAASLVRYEALLVKIGRMEALRDAVEWTQSDGSGRQADAYYRGVTSAARKIRDERLDEDSAFDRLYRLLETG